MACLYFVPHWLTFRSAGDFGGIDFSKLGGAGMGADGDDDDEEDDEDMPELEGDEEEKAETAEKSKIEEVA